MPATLFPRLLRPFALLCACALAPTLHAQTTETGLKARLLNHPLYLRGFWSGDKLHFNPVGQLIGTSPTVSFTLAGFDLKTVQLKGRKLILDGRRIGLEFTKDKPIRVPLSVGRPGDLEEEHLHLEIDGGPNGDYSQALDAIFVDGLPDLVPLLPLHWQPYAHSVFLNEPPTPRPIHPENIPATAIPKRIGGGVKPPKLLGQAEPQFNPAARALKYSGASLVNLWVRTDGTVTHATVVRALGLGLDEQALAAVERYSFAPALEGDKPVLVELNVEVNFQIF
jgi:TonB family protein